MVPVSFASSGPPFHSAQRSLSPSRLQLLRAPTPKPTATQLLLRPTHLALNHRDLFLRQALYPSPSFTTPLLSDACCDVLAKGDAASSTSPPARVLVNPGHGWTAAPAAPESDFAIVGGTSAHPLGMAQEVLVVEEAETMPCPAHLSGAEAAALPLCGLTAWRALMSKSGAAEKVSRRNSPVLEGKSL